MAEQSEVFASGIPVEIGRIDRELKKLWDEGGGALTRASLVNLAVYSEAADSLARNTQIVSRITEDHACRAIVIAAAPEAAENKVQAWISAHCHISRAGSKQICSEQLSFLLEGHSANLLPNIVFSHLDSDLPFYLWWQGEFHDPMDPQLWAWVDRLIFDSRDWADAPGQMRLLQTALVESKQRLIIRDLNWSRSLHHRIGIAQFFDHPDTLPFLRQIERVEIDYAPGYRRTALLLIGWLAGQLRWTLQPQDEAHPDQLAFRPECSVTPGGGGESASPGAMAAPIEGRTAPNAASPGDMAAPIATSSQTEGRTAPKAASQGDMAAPIAVSLQETGGQVLGCCTIHAAGWQFRVAHAAGSDLLETSASGVGGELAHQFLPAGEDSPVALVGEELMRGSRHHVYLRALQSVSGLF